MGRHHRLEVPVSGHWDRMARRTGDALWLPDGKEPMYPDDLRKNPATEARRRSSQVPLVLMAVGVAMVVTLLAGLLRYLSEIFRAKPLG